MAIILILVVLIHQMGAIQVSVGQLDMSVYQRKGRSFYLSLNKLILKQMIHLYISYNQLLTNSFWEKELVL